MRRVKRKRKPKSTSTNVKVLEPSYLKRRILVNTFKKNGYQKQPKIGAYEDDEGYWFLLYKAKTNVMVHW